MSATAPIILSEVRSDALALKTEWIQRRDALVTQCGAIADVADEASFALSAGLLTDAKKHLSALEKARKEMTAPLDAVKKGILDQERQLGNPLLAEVVRVKALSDKYATRKAVEAEEARRKAEEAAAEAQRKAEEEAAEAQRRAEAEAAERRAKAAQVFGAEAAEKMVPVPVVEAPAPVVVPATPVPAAPKADGARIVTRWSFKVVDPNAVPREFLVVDETKIRAWMNYQLKLGQSALSLSGVQFTRTASVEAGR